MNLEKYLEEKKRIEAELAENGKRVLKEHIQGIFDANTNLKGIRWAQFTPYFNDGDTCYFGVREPYFLFDTSAPTAFVCPRCGRKGQEGKYCSEHGALFEADEDSGWDEYSEYGRTKGTPEAKVATEFSRFLCSGALKSVCEDAFGDHTQVTITRCHDGQISIETEEYEHE